MTKLILTLIQQMVRARLPTWRLLYPLTLAIDLLPPYQKISQSLSKSLDLINLQM
jgi:hypothetical protein